MQVRYRKLVGEFDKASFDVTLANQGPKTSWLTPGKRMLLGATARAATPLSVKASEGLAPLEELRTRFKTGELRATDLVDVGNGWQSIENAVPFDDITAVFHAQEQRRKMLGWVAIVFGCTLVAFGMFAAFRSLVVDASDVPNVLRGPARAP
ncbi:MAG: hypothetical protein ACKVPX_12640 [Myxococcaceae bacterium]